MRTEPFINIQDQDCHWYYIPARLKEEFIKDDEQGEADKWSEYRTENGPI